MDGILRYLLVLAFLQLAGCSQHDASQVTVKYFDAAAVDAIEAEAHSKPRNWLHVIFGKYDGRCTPVLTTSARADMETYNGREMRSGEMRLMDAHKYNDDEYTVEYGLMRRMGVDPRAYIYVTSLRLCNEIIQQNISK
jgi:hypothetical protein